MALSYPFFALYLHRDRGVSLSLVGAFLSAIMVLSAASQLIGGEYSDVLGRRRVMLYSLWGRTLAALAMSAAVLWRWPLGGLILLLFLSSLGANGFAPAARGWVADHCPSHERAQAYGLLRIATNLGWAIGPAIGGLLAQRSYALLFLMSALAGGLCAALVTIGLGDHPRLARRSAIDFGALWRVRRDKRFLRFCAGSLVIAAVMAQLVVSLSIHSVQYAGLNERQVGMLFSLNGAMVVLLQYPLGLWLGRFPLTTALGVGSMLYAAGYLWAGLARHLYPMACAVAIVTFGEIALSPALHTLAANLAPVELKGRYLGFWGLFHQVGAALGPLGGGAGLQYLSPHWVGAPWVLVGCAALLAAGIFRSLVPQLSPEEQGLPRHRGTGAVAVGIELAECGPMANGKE